MDQEFEIMEKGADYFIADVEGEKFLVEDEGFDADEGVYKFLIGDSDTVYDSTDSFNTPNEVRLLESEVDSFSSYDEVAEAVLEREVGEGKKRELAGLNQFY